MVLHKCTTQMLQYCIGIVHSCSFHILKQYINIFTTYISQKLFHAVTLWQLSYPPMSSHSWLPGHNWLAYLAQFRGTDKSVSRGLRAKNLRTLGGGIMQVKLKNTESFCTEWAVYLLQKSGILLCLNLLICSSFKHMTILTIIFRIYTDPSYFAKEVRKWFVLPFVLSCPSDKQIQTKQLQWTCQIFLTD